MTQDTIKQRLSAARALIDTPKKWIKGSNGRDAFGRPTAPNGRFVVSRCAFGALMGVCIIGKEYEVVQHLMASLDRHGERLRYGLSGWNDEPERTHAEVMQAFDRAIEDISKANV